MEILTIGRMVDINVPGMLEAENTVLAGSPFVLLNAELRRSSPWRRPRRSA
jgi:hypothetical protein